MGQIEKTVFISYRRTNLPWALNIYQNLTAHGYDVFFDYESIPSGDFEQIILENIRARAHFLIVLTPSMLERIDEPNDWVRREIETALDEKRNIVSMFFEGFNFSDPYISDKLTGKLKLLKNYAGYDVPASYFIEAMDRLRNRYLNVSLDIVKHPVSSNVNIASQKQQVAASKAAPIKEKELTAQEWFEKGFKTEDSDEKFFCYSEAIRLKPDYADAYHNRGNVRYNKGDLDRAIKDYNEAIRLKPNIFEAYTSRSAVRKKKGDLNGAIEDSNNAIQLKPDYAPAYVNRGGAFSDKGDLDSALKDYNEAIRLNPDYAIAYWGRGSTWFRKKEYYSAAGDYQKYFDLGGTDESVREFLNDAKKKIEKH